MTASAAPGAATGKTGLVMLCDVDFAFPDATRTHSVEVARGFARRGFDVDLVARGPDPGGLEPVRYTRAAGREEQRLRRLIAINLSAIRLLWRRRGSSERFYVRDSWSCLPSVLAARLLSYRIVNQVDGIPYGALDQHGSSAVDRLKRTAAIVTGRLSHGVLAVTPEIKTLLTQLARIPPERITVIPNGVDVDFFIPQERQAALARVGLDPAGTYIVFCGGFHHWSDFDTIVESFALVSAKRPEVRLLLVGDGPERERIERRAHELDVTDKIVLTGMVYKRELVRDYLGAATVALLAYRTATIGRTSASPIKLTEYLAAGRAVVAIDMPGISGLLNESEAGIVVPGAAEPMAQAILSLLADGVADEFGARGRALAQTRLSWQSVIDRTLPLFTR